MDDSKAKFIDLVNAQHAFPCPFTMKFIGRAEDQFEARVVAAVREALASVEDPPHTVRPSADAVHVSVTLMPFVSSAEQIWDVYQHVRSVKGLKVSL
jgi:putative lipoic acid-binding regulatory protein